MTLFNEKCVQNDTFQNIRFVGDILEKNGDFRVFLRNILILLILLKTHGKT